MIIEKPAKISIVTISFNQAEFLEQAILSVLNQKTSNIEYIVVDPGSTDGSRGIIKKYWDRIDHVIFEKDAGPADGLNKGFNVATGDIFGFLNSDDTLLPGSLSTVLSFFSQNPKVDVVSGHAEIIDSRGNIKRRFFSDRFRLGMAAYGACTLVQPSTFFRAILFRKCGGFNISNRSNWDSELFIDMALYGAIFFRANSFWSQYRVHEQSITGTGKFHNLHRSHHQNMFEKIKGRKFVRKDRFSAEVFRFARKILNIRDTLQRLRFGPIYRSTQ